jgi:alpha-methylacyl-CoA racemase
VGDFAGGSLFALIGIVLALLERERTGRGQVVDAAIVDGVALLASAQLAEWSDGSWMGRGAGLLSGAAPFYGTYECADGRWFAVGAIEEKFHSVFLDTLDIVVDADTDRFDPSTWPALRRDVAAAFARRPREEWEEEFRHVDGCGDPVLDLDELPDNEHLAARSTIVRDSGGRVAAGVAPRLSHWSEQLRSHPPRKGADTADVLRTIGYTDDDVQRLCAAGAIGL